MADQSRIELTLLQSVMESLDDGVLVIGENDNVVTCNGKYVEMFGLSHPLPDTMDELARLVLPRLKTPENFGFPNSHASDLVEFKDGRMIERRVRARYSDGELVGRVVTYRNVTQRKEWEEALRLSEERFRTVFEAAAFGITLFDMNGNLVACNPAICELLGYSEQEMIALGIPGISHPDEFDSGRNRALLRDLTEGKINKFDIEKRYLKKDGSTFWGHLVASLMRDKKGNPTYGIGLVIDMTKQKLAQKETEKAIRLRDEFIAVASHELRTPITPLKVQNQFLKKNLESGRFSSYPDASMVLKMIQISDRQLEHLSALVEDMLDASRLTAGKLVINRAIHDLSKLAEATLERFRAEFASAGCALSVKIDPGICGKVDRTRFEQIASNLITNSIKYGRGKPVEISLWSETAQAKFRVKDHGIGIAKENHGKIFEQFERFVNVNTYGGFGLGLYITKQIVDAHHGMIDIESDLGRGAVFTVTLPLS